MPDPRDDLVRRGDVLDMIDAESHGDEGLAIIDSRDILALPADPVAAAALALAEAVGELEDYDAMPPNKRAGSAESDQQYRSEYRDNVRSALERLRAALAGRERGR